MQHFPRFDLYPHIWLFFTNMPAETTTCQMLDSYWDIKRLGQETDHTLRCKQSFCSNFWEKVGLSSNLSPSLHTPWAGCHVLYRPIWIKAEMNWRQSKGEGESKPWARGGGRERDVMDSRTVSLELAVWLAFSPVSLLGLIAWQDELGSGEKADKRTAVLAGCSAVMPQQGWGHTHTDTSWQRFFFFFFITVRS